MGKIREVLVQLARVLVDEAATNRRSLDDTLIEEIAGKLYTRHQRDRLSNVRERPYSATPNCQRGKYRKIVREAIEWYRSQK